MNPAFHITTHTRTAVQLAASYLYMAFALSLCDECDKPFATICTMILLWGYRLTLLSKLCALMPWLVLFARILNLSRLILNLIARYVYPYPCWLHCLLLHGIFVCNTLQNA